MDDLLTLKRRIVAADECANDVDRRNAYLDAFADFGSLAANTVAAKDYSAAESILKEWNVSLERAKPHLQEKQTLFSHSRYQAACGTFAEVRGLEAYFQHGDFVEAPRLLEKAEIHHERSAEFAAKVSFPAEAPPQATQMREGIVAMQKAESQRVRGMRLLVQGEFESEAGGLERATVLLEQATATMRLAESQSPASIPTNDAADAINSSGVANLNFIDFAQALLHKTRSDSALLQGRLSAAASEQRERAEALKRCQTMHLRAGTPLNEAFSRRLARDIHVAHLRHDHLSAEASKRPRSEWIKAIAFFAMAVCSAALFMWLASRFEMMRNQAVFAVLLLFVMAVAGIGARLVEWKEAANWLRRSSS